MVIVTALRAFLNILWVVILYKFDDEGCELRGLDLIVVKVVPPKVLRVHEEFAASQIQHKASSHPHFFIDLSACGLFIDKDKDETCEDLYKVFAWIS